MSDLFYLSKNDIPFIEAELIIHQPSIKEIGILGEDEFFSCVQLITFSKDLITDEKALESVHDKNDFEILLSLVNLEDPQSKKQKAQLQEIFEFFFPSQETVILPMMIVLTDYEADENGKRRSHTINPKNFNSLKNILKNMLCLEDIFGQRVNGEYNVKGMRGQALKKQFDNYHKKLAKLKSEKSTNGQKIKILSDYVSILSVGEQKDMNSLLNYSVYQLFDEFSRYQLKMQSDMHFQAQLAGAQNLSEVKNWMGDIRSTDDNDE